VGLRAVVALRRPLEEPDRVHAGNARDPGWSWRNIAAPLDVSRQSVHEKHAGRRNATGHRQGGAGVSGLFTDRGQARGGDTAGGGHVLLGLPAAGQGRGLQVRTVLEVDPAGLRAAVLGRPARQTRSGGW
jgi:hypothetical protein